MSWDEFVRAFWYAVLFPGFAYLAMVARNQGQRTRAGIYLALAIFFLLLLTGLSLLRFYRPIPALLYFNTGAVLPTLGTLVLVQCWGYAHAWWTERRMGGRHEYGEGV